MAACRVELATRSVCSIVRLACVTVALCCGAKLARAALELSDCPSGRVEVVENSTSFSLTCSGYSGTVRWAYQAKRGIYPVTSVGTCGASCELDPLLPPGYFTLTRISPSSSRLTSTATGRNDGAGYVYRCSTGTTDSNTCLAEVIYKADVSSCAVQANKDPWKMTGTCNMDKAFSSQDNYKCTVFRGTSQESQTTLVPSGSITFPVTDGEQGYKRGTCSFTTNLPPPGNYYYRFVIYPGDTETLSQSVAVVKASAPTITWCTPGYVPENSTITCNCTANVGTPPGDVVWMRIKENNNKQLNSGNVMTPQTLTRHDHDVTQFRCDVLWATERVVGNTYTARVGYGPEAITLRLNSKSGNLTVMENESLVFDCQGNGIPTPNMTLVNRDSSVIRSQSSPLFHNVSRARCEDAAVYTCTASNGIGRDQQTTGTLHVNCKPRSDTPQLPTLNFNNQTVTQFFDVTAFPVPDNFTITFNGPNVNSGTSGRKVEDANLRANLSAACVSVVGSLYKAKCDVTVFSINSPSAAGFYTVTVANTHGHQDFTFQLTTFETPREEEESSDAVAIGVGVGVGAVVVIVVVIVLFLVFRKRRQREPDAQKLHNSVEKHQLHSMRQNGSYTDTDETARPELDIQQPGNESVSPAPRDEYAVVIKKKAAPQGPPDSTTYKAKRAGDAADGASGAARPDDKRPKPAAKGAKPKKEKQKKGKTSGTDRGCVYMNVEMPLSMTPAAHSLSEDPRKQVTADGLVYTSVDFSGTRQQKTQAPAPNPEAVVYSAVAFNQQPPSQ